MDEQDRDKLRKNRLKIVQDIDYKEISDSLISNMTITLENNERIKNEPTNQDMMRKLLDMLPKKGPDAYSNFVKVLEEDHKHIATLLTKNDDHENNVRHTKPEPGFHDRLENLNISGGGPDFFQQYAGCSRPRSGNNKPISQTMHDGQNQHNSDQCELPARFDNVDNVQEFNQSLQLTSVPSFNCEQSGGLIQQNTDEAGLPSDLDSVSTNQVPADIFISYNWDSQTQVKALFNSLTGQGYSCWMDINRIAGGDTLNDEIDKGITACKVVLSCITPSYCESKICRREVTLADERKKAIIPLILEKTDDWPPKGPMAPIFAGTIYIKFSEQEQKCWEGPQMNLLLDAIKKHF